MKKIFLIVYMFFLNFNLVFCAANTSYPVELDVEAPDPSSRLEYEKYSFEHLMKREKILQQISKQLGILNLSNFVYEYTTSYIPISYDQWKKNNTNLIDAASNTNLSKEELEEIEKILFLKEVNINAKFESKTPLILAVQFRCKSMVELLLKYDADVNIADDSGWTPLMHAIPDIAIVKLLLDKNANIDVSNKNGITASKLASSYRRKDILDLFEKIELRKHLERNNHCLIQ